MDILHCTDMVYECSVGIHPDEMGITQKIGVSFSARVDVIDASRRDQSDAMRLDYAKADHLIEKMLASRHFNLIETLAEDVAQVILKNFQVSSVVVRITKKPIGLASGLAVTYECERLSCG